MDNDTLKHLQKIEFEILCLVDDFCKVNNIRYSLFCGTLLGAVRHKGFIPWDDDVDIAMTRSEYTKFCNAWSEHPIEGLYFEHFETDDHCFTSHGKVRKNGTVLLTTADNPKNIHHGIWIDIFPLDKLSNKARLKRKTLFQARKIIALTRVNKVIPGDGIRKNMTRTVFRVIPKTFRKKSLQKTVVWFQKENDEIFENYVWKSMAAGWHIKKWSFPQGMDNEYVEIEFEHRLFPVYGCYEDMLSLLYGNYMELPNEADRVCKHEPIRIEFGDDCDD